MTLDILDFIPEKEGNPDAIRESQKRRGLSTEVVDEVIEMYKEWVKLDFETNQISKKINAKQKEITAKKKAKESADSLVAEKTALDAEKAQAVKTADDAREALRIKAAGVGNLVYKEVPVSMNEDDNKVIRTWHPDGPIGQVKQRTDIMPHHEVLLRLDAIDLERGAKIAGHRGYFLTGDGLDLNQALISYGLDFLRGKGYKKIQTPFFMRKEFMAKTAQLEQFDEELYKVVEGGPDEEDKYLIATSEQPISSLHAGEWFESPKEQLPIKYAGYSTCFRKEAGSSGKDTWGIFRVHQFEKIEQFLLTSPTDSWEHFNNMVGTSEAFYQSLGLPYQLIAIVSGALNLAASQKYDLEAWFPFQGAYKELVSTSNCTDYQSRRLEVRHGLKKAGEERKQYVHMLNGTLCATERAMCCLVENWQTPDGLTIPPVLRPYMQNREFIPWQKELPKSLQRKKA